MLTAQSIRESFESHSDLSGSDFFYCLIDHAGMPGLVRQLSRAQASWASLFEGTTEARALEAAPLLFRVDPVRKLCHPDLLPWIVSRGIYASSVMFLATPLPLDELARELSARLNSKISEDMEVLLRFYDPRIFEQLMVVLTPTQRKMLLSVARRWWFVDRRGELKTVDAEFSIEEKFEAPLQLLASQETALLDASEPDLIAAQLLSCIPDEYMQIPPAERHAFIASQIITARTFGITATCELALYCALALRHGNAFPNDPRWTPAFDEIRRGRIGLIEAVATAAADDSSIG